MMEKEYGPNKAAGEKFLAEKTKITKEQLVDERYNFFSNGY